MKILVATGQTQGERESDFCFVPEGEIVRFGFECDRDRDEVDGGCGCRRSMSGLRCAKGTTTMLAIERPDLTEAELATALCATARRSGAAARSARRAAAAEAARLIAAARPFAPGDVVEKRGDQLRLRRPTPHTRYALPLVGE